MVKWSLCDIATYCIGMCITLLLLEADFAVSFGTEMDDYFLQPEAKKSLIYPETPASVSTGCKSVYRPENEFSG